MRGGRVGGAGAIGKIEREQQARARIGVVGRLGQAKAERLHRVGHLAAGHQSQGEVVMQRGIARIDGERRPIRGHRGVQFGGLVREIADVHEGERRTWIARRGALESRPRFVAAAQRAIAQPKFGQNRCVLGSVLQRGLQTGERGAEFAALALGAALHD